MPHYRRHYEGRMFFFTLVTYQRRRLFGRPRARELLRGAIERTQEQRPWRTEAIVLLPDHLHTLWLLPGEDTDYSSRIAALKKRFTRAWLADGGGEGDVSSGQRRHRRRGVWQARFWEHTIRDARDFHLHLDYIHANPVKHGLVGRPREWAWSSFGRHVQEGWYEPDWCGSVEIGGSGKHFWPE